MKAFRNDLLSSVINALKKLEDMNNVEKCCNLCVDSVSISKSEVLFNFNLFHGGVKRNFRSCIYVNDNDFNFLTRIDFDLSSTSGALHGTDALEKQLSRNLHMGQYVIHDGTQIYYKANFAAKVEDLDISSMCQTLFAFIYCSTSILDQF